METAVITPPTPQVPAPLHALPAAPQPTGWEPPLTPVSGLGPAPERREWPPRAPVGLAAVRHCGYCWTTSTRVPEAARPA